MSTVLASEQQQQQQQQLQQQQQQQQQVVRNPVVLQASNVRLLSPETNNREQFSSNPLPITQKYQKLQVPILSKSQCSQNF
jgi:ribosomal protein L24